MLVKLSSFALGAAWAPLIIRQLVRYRRHPHPGKLALASAMLLLCFLGMMLPWAEQLTAPDLRYIRPVLFVGHVVVCLHFHLALWLSARQPITMGSNGGQEPPGG